MEAILFMVTAAEYQFDVRSACGRIFNVQKNTEQGKSLA
jgi:hypothetical protein